MVLLILPFYLNRYIMYLRKGDLMKKLLFVMMLLFLAVGCNEKKEIVKKNSPMLGDHLSKGYIVNVYRNVESLSDKMEDMGKGYVNMQYLILVDHYSTIDYDKKEDFVAKQIVKNIKIKKSSKIGTVGDIYANYQPNFNSYFKIVGTKTIYEKTHKDPLMYPEQNAILIELDRVAYVDSILYPDNISTRDLYSALGITTDAVTLTVTFTIELVTVSGRILYRDYEVVVPPTGYDISGSEFRTDFIEEDVEKMDKYLERN